MSQKLNEEQFKLMESLVDEFEKKLSEKGINLSVSNLEFVSSEAITTCGLFGCHIQCYAIPVEPYAICRIRC